MTLKWSTDGLLCLYPRDYQLLRDAIRTLGVANFITGWRISHMIFLLTHSSDYEKQKLNDKGYKSGYTHTPPSSHGPFTCL